MTDAIGIDFGTTNSLISIILSDKALCFVDGNLPHPSMVCYADGKVVCGRKAKQRFEGLASNEADGIVRSPKRLLGKGTHYVLGREMEPAQIVSDLMRFLRDDAQNRGIVDSSFDRAVVSIPVSMDGRRRRELRDALMQAGINVVQFVHEPLAALYAHFRDPEPGARSYRELADELALVFDWGGGTLDLTLCHLGKGALSQIANFGDNEVGGDFIDEALMRYVLEQVCSVKKFEGTPKEAPGAKAKLLELCEKAKIQLSRKGSALVYVPDYFMNAEGDNDLDFNLTREAYDDLSSRFISRGIGAIEKVLDRLDIDRRRIALCLATGGMINTPSIRDALIQLFGADRLHVSPRGDRIISEGCAWIASDEARLRLAKPIEVLEARENYLPVFKAGDSLPVEGEVFAGNLTMYCVDPRDGLAKIKLARPRQLGKAAATDPRDNYGVVTVRVDPDSKPFMERIDVTFEIDQDLVMIINATSALVRNSDKVEIMDLEFSLDASLLLGDTGMTADSTIGSSQETQLIDKGGLRARSNVTTRREKLDLVPGELLYQLEPTLFDRRNPNPLPQLLFDEKLYYSPCSICKRRYNHPDCRCSTQLRH